LWCTEEEVTDAQIIAIAITVLAILGGALINNTRMGDVKEVLRAELQKETSAIRHLIERNQDALLTEFARFDQRLTRLEERMH
jgi:hypothetical protein